MIKYTYYNHLIRKRFGQNFLHNKIIINSIINLINPKPEQILVEIGPGLGALTIPMLKYIPSMTVIELDRDLVKKLNKNKILKNKLNIIQQDVLTFNFNKLAYQFNQKLRIFGNLPYNISIKLIFYLCKFYLIIDDMYFMMQQEVVNRLIAKPNSKFYGKLSILIQLFFKIKIVLKVPPTSFIPITKVNSSVIHITKNKKYLNVKYNLKSLKIITKLAFNQRRKQIKNSLQPIFSEKELKLYGINLKLRAENLSIENYLYLSNFLTKKY